MKEGRIFRPERVLARGFLILILLGTVLLSLPFASGDGDSAGLFDSLFTAASAVCVTGLTARDTALGWSRAGQTIILCLIQLGGLGFMAFATLIMAALDKRITLRGRMLLRESMNENTFSGLSRLTLVYGAIALAIEGMGAMALAIRFIPLYGWGEGIYYSIFHAVSAFCNAGFDLMGGYDSLSGFAGDPFILLPLSFLIILGGLGFPVILDCLKHHFRWRKFSLHGKVVLLANGILLLGGAAFFTIAEWHHPETLGALPPGMKIMNGFFSSVTLRTAGFSTLDQGALRDGSKVLGTVLMFIGASPASTGGGVKTTTVSVLMLLLLSMIRGREDIPLLGRRLARDIIPRAIAVLFISMLFLLLSVIILSFLEEGRFAFLDLMYECVSAMGTVGVSCIGTPNLTLPSRMILLPMMFLGRVGPMTLALALARRNHHGGEGIQYPEEKLMIG